MSDRMVERLAKWCIDGLLCGPVATFSRRMGLVRRRYGADVWERVMRVVERLY